MRPLHLLAGTLSLLASATALAGPWEVTYELSDSVSSQGTDPHRRFEQWNRLWILETEGLFREVGHRVFPVPGRLATQMGRSIMKATGWHAEEKPEDT